MNQLEHVDIIDEEGKVVKTISKDEAHQTGELHTCVVSEVIDSQGRWLLVKQASDRQDAGQYVSPIGGHVSAGETEIEALKREAEEEIGLRAEFKHEFVGRAVLNRQVIGRQENHLFIMFKISSDVVPIINHESESYRYFPEEELKQEMKDHPESFGDAFHFVVKTVFPHLLKN